MRISKEDPRLSFRIRVAGARSGRDTGENLPEKRRQ